MPTQSIPTNSKYDNYSHKAYCYVLYCCRHRHRPFFSGEHSIDVTVGFSHLYLDRFFCSHWKCHTAAVAVEWWWYKNKAERERKEQRINRIQSERRRRQWQKKCFRFSVVSFKKHLAHDDVFPWSRDFQFEKSCLRCLYFWNRFYCDVKNV